MGRHRDLNTLHCMLIAKETGLKPEQTAAAAGLLEEGCTVPFIARYRKEATGSLDEVAIVTIRDRLEQLAELDKRRDAVLRSLEERNLLSDELRDAIGKAQSMARLEDLYLPFRPKRRTRASIATERGLAPLADLLLDAAVGKTGDVDPVREASRFVDPEKNVNAPGEALAGARDILAERAAEDARVRASLREFFARKASLRSKVAKGKEEEGAKYRDYFDWSESVRGIPSHRILALLRGEREGVLSLSLLPPEEEGIRLMEQFFARDVASSLGASAPRATEQLREAIRDGYGRLAAPSMETELRGVLKRIADEQAVVVFARNVHDVLMESPLGQKSVLAVDPGVRTGCKLAMLDAQGSLLATDVIFLQRGDRDAADAVRKVRALAERHAPEAIAVGNGTAGRETEAFFRELSLPGNPVVVSVNESGASIYSASDAAREEFPDQDLTVRGAVSIGRRLQDPLAELVKIDPKSIGVGQYQHDVEPKLLKQALDDVVSSCVNSVGVEVNSASRQLLTSVSGLGPGLAGAIVAHRRANGPFRSRSDLKKVPRLGPKAFQQSAGFLRIRNGAHPLDASAVHPENYGIVEKMARDLGCTVRDLMASVEMRGKIDIERYVCPEAGIPTLKDILAELAKPGRDPRASFEAVPFAANVREIGDLSAGMVLPGIVTNVTAFGAFVDIGVHQDGLVHVSRLADRFVANAADVVRAGQRVRVTVIEVDLQRRRISLSMKKPREEKR